MTEVIIIAAVAQNGVIGNQNLLPWKSGEIKGDLARFKKLTTGHPVIMGRSTYESLGKPLPQRLNIVLSRSPRSYSHKNLYVARSLEEALSIAETASPPDFDSSKVYIIGGSQPFNEAINTIATHLEITKVRKDYRGNVLFPSIDSTIWRLVKSEEIIHEGIVTHSYDSYVKNER